MQIVIILIIIKIIEHISYYFVNQNYLQLYK